MPAGSSSAFSSLASWISTDMTAARNMFCEFRRLPKPDAVVVVSFIVETPTRQDVPGCSIDLWRACIGMHGRHVKAKADRGGEREDG